MGEFIIVNMNYIFVYTVESTSSSQFNFRNLTSAWVLTIEVSWGQFDLAWSLNVHSNVR